MAIRDQVSVWEEFGEGCGRVYLYYYPSEKSHARFIGQPVWACKIGMTTDSDVHDYIHRTKLKKDRMLFEIAACEYPVIPLILKTDHPKALETQIHSILKTFERWHNIPGANEWYFTNPDEVIQIYLFIGDFDICR